MKIDIRHLLRFAGAIILPVVLAAGCSTPPSQDTSPSLLPAQPQEPPQVQTELATAPEPIPVPGGVSDPDIYVDIYNADKVWTGTTLLPDNHNIENPRVIEVNMWGEIVWEYVLPQNLKQYTNPGFDVELLPNNNMLLVLPLKGVYEIDHDGNVVWSYLDQEVTHDADRLEDGNTLMVFGGRDDINSAQVKEVSPDGELVWSWYARDYFNKPPYKDIYLDGWTHTNAATRLANGNTLISLRNFNFVVEVDPSGTIVRTIGEGIVNSPHDPEVLSNGNILLASQWWDKPHSALEIEPDTGEIAWEYAIVKRSTWPVRDANRLPNGNTLITGSTEVIEVTDEGEIVWRFELNTLLPLDDQSRKGFYKAERITMPR